MSGVLHAVAATVVNPEPYWSNVVGLLKFEGTDGSTTITDSKGLGGWTSTATLSTTQKKFGSSSLYLDGSKDCRKSTACNLNSKVAFTFEGWIYPTTVATGDTPRTIFSTRTGAVFSPFNLFQYNGTLSVLIDDGGSWAVDEILAANILTANTWHHVAVVGDGTNIKVYCGGVVRGTYTHYTWSYGSVPISIGQAIDSDAFVGYIDECRFTVGAARYTANFTAPTAAFPS